MKETLSFSCGTTDQKDEPMSMSATATLHGPRASVSRSSLVEKPLVVLGEKLGTT